MFINFYFMGKIKALFSKPVFKTIFIILVVVLFVLATILVTKKKPAAQAENQVTPVKIQKPITGDLTQSITISGYVEAKAMIPVVPFVQGTITSYAAKAGDFVKKDTILATIDDAPFKQTMLQAQAAYWATQSTFERIEVLYKSGAATQQNYDSAKAQRDATKAQYDLAKLQMDYTQVKAPVDGTILIADQAVGSIGTQTTPVAVLADLNNQVVRLKVPEKYFDLFQLQGNKLKVKVVRPAEKGMYQDAETTATIENIAPYISPQSKNFVVVCRLDEPGERFRPGMFVKVTVDYGSFKDVPLLPVTARKLDGSVYVYDEKDSTVKFLFLEKVNNDDENFIVPEEYKDSWFVVQGQNSVFDGQIVKVIEDSEKPEQEGESEADTEAIQ